jgi:hypothetical protein
MFLGNFQQTTWRYIPGGSTLQDKVVLIFKQYTVNMYEREEVWLYTFLTLLVVEGEWSASCRGSCNPAVA